MPMSKTRLDNTPVHIGCRYGDIEMVQYLIGECGCDPMSKNNDGNTPLHVTCSYGDIKMVGYLIGECRCYLTFCLQQTARVAKRTAMIEWELISRSGPLFLYNSVFGSRSRISEPRLIIMLRLRPKYIFSV